MFSKKLRAFFVFIFSCILVGSVATSQKKKTKRKGKGIFSSTSNRKKNMEILKNLVPSSSDSESDTESGSSEESENETSSETEGSEEETERNKNLKTETKEYTGGTVTKNFLRLIENIKQEEQQNKKKKKSRKKRKQFDDFTLRNYDLKKLTSDNPDVEKEEKKYQKLMKQLENESDE